MYPRDTHAGYTRMNTLPLNLDGYTDLPAGKLANVATCLEMRAPPHNHAPPPLPGGFSLDPLGAGDAGRYRTLFAEIGTPWLWFSRLAWSNRQIAETIGDADVEAFALVGTGGDAGLLELDFRSQGDVELAFFGLTPAHVGGGLGRALMNEAITRAFARGPRRFWVHTCTLDHPAALGFYIASGFTPYKRQIEVVDDPRLTGVAPRDSAPHVPLIPADSP